MFLFVIKIFAKLLQLNKTTHICVSIDKLLSKLVEKSLDVIGVVDICNEVYFHARLLHKETNETFQYYYYIIKLHALMKLKALIILNDFVLSGRSINVFLVLTKFWKFMLNI